ncbi:amino acid ABC transporter ATP-binding protein [Siculibacillus lacustris]|uniref:Amino acid ABC transporter ATP-binding protein n=1 Tax=Siculibacillus lacustris TaxID=1549641 RepID=A0A4Q9VXS1_9HYPH|nr:ATP-binding cassette domain-containing protein [Siculibacillus lacustris]TBW41292.1 amino acid ABC transporter ATP-binding protein [Siculibacillus lacustris]
MIRFEQVGKTWRDGSAALEAVDGEVRRGEVVALCGPSGAGKSTLLRTVNRLVEVDRGRVVLDGTDVRRLRLDRLRRRVGFVFQSIDLFRHLSAVDNVALILRRAGGLSRGESRQRAELWLDRVGMADRAGSLPAALSGGQQQRVAIARAMCLDPEVLLLDEPTSALDPELVTGVRTLLRDLAARGTTMIVVTHEAGFARGVADRLWQVTNGRLVADRPAREAAA